MRWLTLVALAALIGAPTTAAANSPDKLLCAAAGRQWAAAKAGGDAKAMSRVIGKIGPHCATVIGARLPPLHQKTAAATPRPAHVADGSALKPARARLAVAPSSRARGASPAPKGGRGSGEAGGVAAADDLRLRAVLGDAKARAALGMLYYNGQGGMPQSYAQALYWLRLAADAGDAPAQTQLGLMSANGVGRAPDPTDASVWFLLAAHRGDPTAQLNLGLMFEFGHGVEQSYATAADWYRRAADQGNPTAEYNLGLLYDAGRGLKQDHARAVALWTRAAEGGNVDALNNLGAAYALGTGTEPSRVEAYKWFDLAVTRLGPIGGQDLIDATHNRDFLASEMTSDEVAKAKRMAGEWKQKF
jgi:TPR repeat protein